MRKSSSRRNRCAQRRGLVSKTAKRGRGLRALRKRLSSRREKKEIELAELILNVDRDDPEWKVEMKKRLADTAKLYGRQDRQVRWPRLLIRSNKRKNQSRYAKHPWLLQSEATSRINASPL
jgi:hypothetical protein